ITGSTDGIGKLAAIKLAKLGHRIYLHGRNSDKLETVASEIQAVSDADVMGGFVADFSNLDAVGKMSNEVNEKIPTLDILVNNAGIFKSPQGSDQSGTDIRMTVNYLAPYLLTSKIIASLRSSADPRVINLSSAAQASVSLELLQGKRTASAQEAYAQSKLAILMWSFHLAEQEPDLLVTALNPGSLLNTKMVRDAYGKFWSSADKGRDIICDIALSPRDNTKSGKYYDNDRGGYASAHPDAYNRDVINSLMRATDQTLQETH
nr:SDR family NAD(P)-dependent oxidoreductase [Saprospiraceae bacterium]